MRVTSADSTSLTSLSDLNITVSDGLASLGEGWTEQDGTYTFSNAESGLSATIEAVSPELVMLQQNGTM